jgi:HD-like signal output (HDOD) protein
VTVEQEAFGGTHAALGAMLCDRWDFHAELREPVRCHHDLSSAGVDHVRRTAGVMLANALSHERRIGWAVDTAVVEIPEDALNALELTAADARALGDRFENRRHEIESFTQAFM